MVRWLLRLVSLACVHLTHRRVRLCLRECRAVFKGWCFGLYLRVSIRRSFDTALLLLLLLSSVYLWRAGTAIRTARPW